MDKILFITRYFGEMMGGTVCSNRNRESLEKIFNKVIEYRIIDKVGKRKIYSKIEQLLFGYMGGIDQIDKNNITQIIKQNQCNHIFIDSSLLGYLSKYIKGKFPNIEITCFFHNFEYNYIKATCKGIKRNLYMRWAFKNEKMACKYSTHIITLNNRDAVLISKYYKRVPDLCIPISIPDKYQEHKDKLLGEQTYMLFIGSYFPPNINGITWFINNVLPFINNKLIIVGKDMDKLYIPEITKAKIHIYSNVPDLTPFYNNAKFMIMPIFSGSGMKVKTAEALMYGKFIIGTQEAFEGYDISEQEGIICNNANEFIKSINEFSERSNFNKHSRNLYLNKYSFESTLHSFIALYKNEL